MPPRGAAPAPGQKRSAALADLGAQQAANQKRQQRIDSLKDNERCQTALFSAADSTLAKPRLPCGAEADAAFFSSADAGPPNSATYHVARTLLRFLNECIIPDHAQVPFVLRVADDALTVHEKLVARNQQFPGARGTPAYPARSIQPALLDYAVVQDRAGGGCETTYDHIIGPQTGLFCKKPTPALPFNPVSLLGDPLPVFRLDAVVAAATPASPLSDAGPGAGLNLGPRVYPAQCEFDVLSALNLEFLHRASRTRPLWPAPGALRTPPFAGLPLGASRAARSGSPGVLCAPASPCPSLEAPPSSAPSPTPRSACGCRPGARPAHRPHALPEGAARRRSPPARTCTLLSHCRGSTSGEGALQARGWGN
jgi:hypothetical protein